MWGNRLGWIISAALVLIMGSIIGMAYAANSARTGPTEFTTGDSNQNLAEIALPIDPKTILPAMSKSGDGGSAYREAVSQYQGHLAEYERMARAPSLDKAKSLAAINSILAAADYASANLLEVDTVVKYGPKPALNALQQLGSICVSVGVDAARKKQYDEARQYLNASLVLGYHLFEQRLTRMQLSAGLGLMSSSATVLGQIAKINHDDETARKYARFVEGYQTFYQDRIQPVERAITSIDPAVQRQHVGDVFAMVEQSKERVWRVEGVLKLGMYKFNTNTAGDRRAAIRKIRELAKDADPAIAAAANAAKDLTVEQYRNLGAD